MSNKCSNTFPHQCKFKKYGNYSECILHCDKKQMSSLHNPYFTEPENFFRYLADYIVNQVFETNKETNDFNKKLLEGYLIGSYIPEYDNLKTKLLNCKIVFSKICFPNTDEREHYNYETILKKLGKIWFNYCDFYIPHLNIEHIECFFQDCNFYEYWSLKNFKVSQELDDLEVYNACTFHKDVSASGGDKDKYTLDNVQFNGCTFKKELTFENINAVKPIFKDWNGFQSTINKLKINDCSFENRFILNNYTIENMFLKNTICKGKFEFTNCIVAVMDIDNCNFEKLAEFYGSIFNQFKIFKSIFTDYTGFERCEFGIDNNIEKSYVANFQYVTFLSFINFRNTKFKSGLMFEDTNLKEYPNFLNSDIKFENTSKETYRIIKYSFDKLGNHIEANKYFSLEMKKYKEELSKNANFSQEKFIFWFNETVSNYGQNYLMPTMWLILTSIVYTLIIILSKNADFINWLKIHNEFLFTIKFLNSWFTNIFVLNKFLPKNLEFITILFTILQSTLVWHILVSVRRHTKR